VEDGVATDQLKEMTKRVGAVAVFGCHWRMVEGERRRRLSNRTCIITISGSRNFLFSHILHGHLILPPLIFIGLGIT